MNKALCARDYFSSLRFLRYDIERTNIRIRTIESDLDIHGIDYESGTFYSSGKVPISRGISDLIVKRESLERIMRRYEAFEEEANYVISALSTPEKQRVMTLRFLDLKTVDETAKIMKYTTSGVKSLQRRAFEELDKDGKLERAIEEFEAKQEGSATAFAPAILI